MLALAREAVTQYMHVERERERERERELQ